jgi:hypothetical protein
MATAIDSEVSVYIPGPPSLRALMLQALPNDIVSIELTVEHQHERPEFRYARPSLKQTPNQKCPDWQRERSLSTSPDKEGLGSAVQAEALC